MSNPVRKVLSVQGRSHLFSHRGGDTPECLQVMAVTACTELYGLEIPACVILVPCVPSGLVTSRIEPWGNFLLSSLFLMWRLNIISAVSAALGRHRAQKLSTFHMWSVTLARWQKVIKVNPSVNHSISLPECFTFCVLHVAHAWFRLPALNFIIYFHFLELKNVLKLLINLRGRIPPFLCRWLPAYLPKGRPNIYIKDTGRCRELTGKHQERAEDCTQLWKSLAERWFSIQSRRLWLWIPSFLTLCLVSYTLRHV